MGDYADYDVEAAMWGEPRVWQESWKSYLPSDRPPKKKKRKRKKKKKPETPKQSLTFRYLLTVGAVAQKRTWTLPNGCIWALAYRN